MAFQLRAADPPPTPLIVTVLHAGQDYRGLTDDARVPLERLRLLEDRHADLLAEGLVADGHACLIALRPRAWVDLNRQLGDLDSGMVEGARPGPLSQRARNGLGLVPRRLAPDGDLWRRPLSARSIAERIADWRAFRTLLRAQVERTLSAHGRCVLLDLHSMPPLPSADVVIGDHHGRTCGRRFAEAARRVGEAAGWRVSMNTPYAGGALVREFGEPRRHADALQLEIGRDLYLDKALTDPGPGLAAAQAQLVELGRALCAEAAPLPLAAE